MATMSGLLYLGSGILADAIGYYRYLCLICMIAIFVYSDFLYWKENTR
jgi:hypothetical protein